MISSILLLYNEKKLLYRQIDGTAPTFTKKPAIRQEDDGKRLLFECKIQADPKPGVSWSHNGALVAESDRHKVKFCDFLNVPALIFFSFFTAIG